MTYVPDYIASDLVMVQPTANLNKVGQWVIHDIHDSSHHLTVKGSVLMNPERLTYTGRETAKYVTHPKTNQMVNYLQFLNSRSLEFDTKIETQVGDEVIFRYSNHMECERMGLFWPLKGNGFPPVLFVPYDTIFMTIRKDQQIMCNGHIWVEPILWTKDELKASEKFVTENAGQRKTGVGIVRKVGSLCKHYLYEKRSDFDQVKVGDVICFKKTAGVTAEWLYHNSLNEGRFPYYVMQRKDILAINNSLKHSYDI